MWGTYLEVGCPVGNGEGEVDGNGEGEAVGNWVDPACLHSSRGIHRFAVVLQEQGRTMERPKRAAMSADSMASASGWHVIHAVVPEAPI